MTDTPAPVEGYTLYDPDDPFEMRSGPFHWRQSDDGIHYFALRTEERHCNRHEIVHGGRLDAVQRHHGGLVIEVRGAAD